MLKGKLLCIGKIELSSPALIGSGESELTDLDLLRDKDGVPFIPATSFAGVLRHSIKVSSDIKDKIEEFWGLARLDDKARQSSIQISDLIPETTPKVVIRDGVKIQNSTGTAEKHGKFDYELIDRGTIFNFSFEVNLYGKDDSFKKAVLSTIIETLREGRIRIGAKTNSGFGRLNLKEANLYEFDFTKPDDVKSWFKYLSTGKLPAQTQNLYQTLDISERRLTIEADFIIKTSLIVREYNIDPLGPDTTHIKSAGTPVLPGTSLKGALRARAERIVKTLQVSTSVINELFGYVDVEKGSAKKGRITVEETLIEGYPEEVQTRIKIDRFTGGTIEGALVETRPLFSAKNPKEFKIKITVSDYRDYEVGLLLLLLKDLYTGDLPVGGEKSIGRGVLEGKKVKICLESSTIEFDSPLKLNENERALLNKYVEALSKLGGKRC